MRKAIPVLTSLLAVVVTQSAYAESTIDYAKQIEPIFAAHCYGCHGEAKGLGRLRLHDAAAIAESMKAHDDLLQAGQAEASSLYARLVLPADNPKRMPKGSDPLSAEQTALVKQWIAEGATFTSAEAPAEPTTETPSGKPTLPPRPTPPAATAEAIGAVEATGALILPVYAGSSELRVSFPAGKSEVTDATVAALVPLAPQLVELDLSGTAVTDACGESLAKLVNLDALHLEKTVVTDDIAPALGGMSYLKYLNLHSTKVTDRVFETLKTLPSLESLYLWQTDVSYEAAKAMQQAVPGLEVNLGWNHPGVVRERLNAELARVEQQATTSATAIQQAEQALEAARSENKAATDRAAEIKKQLEALAAPAGEAPPTE